MQHWQAGGEWSCGLGGSQSCAQRGLWRGMAGCWTHEALVPRGGRQVEVLGGAQWGPGAMAPGGNSAQYRAPASSQPQHCSRPTPILLLCTGHSFACTGLLRLFGRRTGCVVHLSFSQSCWQEICSQLSFSSSAAPCSSHTGGLSIIALDVWLEQWKACH